MANRQKFEEALLLMERFICRQDSSVEFAKKLEGILATSFSENPVLSDFADTLAQYHPRGESGLLDYHAVKYQAIEALKELWKLEKQLSSRV